MTPADQAGEVPAGAIPHFGFVTPQQRTTVAELLDQWAFADATGWDSAWVFDHLLSVGGGDDGSILEGWTLLAGLAMRVSRIGLGVFVSGITYRPPAMLFKQAVTVDHLSEGRLVLGVGAAWNRREHEAHGLPFPPIGERVTRVGEALEAFRLLETQARTTYAGRTLTLAEAPFEPKPVQPRLPILVGTTGERMLRHLARWGDRWEGGGNPERMAALNARLDAICAGIGRNPAEIRRGIVADDEAFAALRSDAAFRRHVLAYAAVGVDTFYFNIPRGAPGATLRRISERTIPELREELAVRRALRPAAAGAP